MTEFEKYVHRMEEIRRLSTPSLDDIEDADGYSRLLRDNFEKIGELAAENREFLDTYLYPLIASDSICNEDIENLYSFSDELICAENAENLDVHMVSLISGILLSDSLKSEDLEDQIRGYDLQIGIYYEIMNMTKRIR